MAEPRSPRLPQSWLDVLGDEFEKPHMQQLRAFLVEEKKQYRVFPPGDEIFSAFHHTPFDKLKAVIIGQDPYHGANQAHGLCFSVRKGIAVPPSLENIFEELKNDLGIPPARHGDLSCWADQGVLLLNAVLTVRQGQAASHQNKGWEQFTDRVIEELATRKSGLVFLLWGKAAQTKAARVDRQKHHILMAAHPSPYSADRFFGCRHFSKANAYLEGRGQAPIQWELPD
jgi:uracil-DNA glycosylase